MTDEPQQPEGRLIIAIDRFDDARRAAANAGDPVPPVHLSPEQWRDVLVSLRRRGAHVVGFGGPLKDTIASIEIQTGRTGDA